MNYVFVAFKSRAQGMRLYDMLRRAGISCSIINTPREASVGCGLSVKFDPKYTSHASSIANNNGLLTIIGYFNVDGNKITRL